ncbi:MAG: class I SAM-dependent RNA methyltransferase [Trueperaceae bacterium]
MQLELNLERMVHGGNALARLEDGRIALIRGGIPGEVVRADVLEKSGLVQGKVIGVLEASPDRVKTPKHPGLDYGFVSYARQLELKRDVVKDSLSRSLKREVNVPNVHPAPKIWNYRNTIQPVVKREGQTYEKLGYRVEGSHDVVLLDTDPTANETIYNLWQQWPFLNAPKGIRELVIRANDDGDMLLSLIASASAKNYLAFAHHLVGEGIRGVSYAPYDERGRFRSGSEKLAGEKTVLQAYGKFNVSVSTTNFSQPNPSAASQLYEALEKLATSGNLALDVYAGSGIIGMYLSSKFKGVIALEIDKGSITRGQRDTERLGITNLEFVKTDAKYLNIPPDADLITVDPPRAGLNKEVRQTINASSVKQLIYVSCDVATWARDVAEFEKVGWSLQQLEPFDFYPHTHHIEVLSKLVR